MKKLISHWIKALALLALLLSTTISNAQSFTISVQNLIQTSANKLEFDVYLLNTNSSQPFELATSQLGFLFNSLIYTGGTVTVTYNNTGSGLSAAQVFTAATSVVTTVPGYPDQTLVRLAGRTPPGAGNGTIISPFGLGTLMTHFTITCSVNFTANSTPNINFCSNTPAPQLYATRVNVYVGTANTQLTVTPGTNAIVYDSPILNPPPTSYTVSGGGSYCQGEVGLPVGLTDSEIGVTYTILKNGVAQTPTVLGTGASITFGNQLSGVYTVSGTNVTGTTLMAGNATITENPGPAVPEATLIQPTCTVATGTITVTAPTGAGMTYSIDGSTYTNTTGIFTALVSGSYNVTAQSAAGCISNGASVTINAQPATPPAPTITLIQATCAVATGTITVTTPTGTGMTYSINGSTYTNTTGIFNTVAAGTYSVTAKSAAGCISNGASVTINVQPVTPSAPATGPVTQPTCALGTGSFLLSGLPSGAWTLTRFPDSVTTLGSGTSTTISGLASGTYNYTVTNSAGCTSVASGNIVINAQPATPTDPIAGSITQPTCALSTGSVILNGLPSIGTWIINPGAISGSGTSTVISGLSTGTHNFTVTNSAGCTSLTSVDIVIIAQPATPLIPVVGTITQPTCAVSTGSVVLSGLPSTGTWTLTRTPGGVLTSGTGTNITISTLATGNYTFTVTNASGCISETTTNVDIPAQPASPSSPVQTIDCTLGFGQAVVNVTSPTGAGLEYSLDGGAYQAATSFANIANGNHIFTVRNSSGCTTAGVSFSVSCGCVNGPVVSLTSIIGSTCGTTAVTISGNTFGGNATSVTITENGAGTVNPATTSTSPFAFTYTPAAGDAGSTVIITVTTNNPSGAPCAAATATYILTVNANPAIPAVGSITPPTCTESTGSVILSGLPATGTWTLTRTPGGVTSGTGTSATISGLATGSYTFTVTNANNCISGSSAGVIINAQPSTPLAPVIGAITPLTCTISTGDVALSGLPSSGTWTITRNPGGVTSTGSGTNTTISNLAAGTYTFTVTNSVGCISTESGNVVLPVQPETPLPPSVGPITYPTCILSTGSVQLNGLPSSGTWILTRYPGTITSTGTGTSTIVSGLASGTYNFLVDNSAGCTSPASENVVINAQPVTPSAPIAGTPTQPTCTLSTGSVVLSGLPSTGTWIINPGSISGTGTSTTVSGLVTGTHNYTVTNSVGCTSPASANVVINAQPVTPSAPLVGTINQPTCTISTGSVELTGLPSSGTWTLIRTPGGLTTTGTGTSETISGLITGTYTYTVTNSSGCTSVPSINVVINAQPVSPSSPSQTVDCTLGFDKAGVTVTSPTGIGLDYSLDGGAYQSGTTFTNIANGNHIITVRNSLGCTTAGVSFSVSCGCVNGPVVSLTSTSGSTCGTIPVTVSGNTFGGSATSVTITENGAGTVTPASTGTWPFAFTYTPGAGDVGSTVTITVTTNNPLGAPCASAVANYTLIVNPLPTVILPLAGPYCIDASPVQLTGSPTGGIYTGTGVNATGLFTPATAGAGSHLITYTYTNLNGCTSPATITVTVNSLPVATASNNGPVCSGKTLSLTGGSAGMTIYAWTGPAGFSSALQNPTVSPGATSGMAGIYTLTVTNSNGCQSVATTTVTVNPLPAPVALNNGPVCAGSPLNLSGSPAAMTAYSWNGPNSFISSLQSPAVSANAVSGMAGLYTLTVTNTNGCQNTATTTVIVNPLPTATISGTATVCKDGVSPDVSFMGAAGTAPYTFTYKINAGSNQTLTTTVGNSISVPVPTGTAGTYTYTLVSVSDAGSSTCSQTQTGSAVVTVNQLPTATISGTTNICKDAATPVITFTGALGTAPYTFTYMINGGATQTVTTTIGSSVNVAVPTSTAGIFTYSLANVHDASSTTCSQIQGGSTTVTVNPLPTATISGTTVVCRTGSSPIITFTGASGTAPYTFAYTLNGGGNQTVTTTAGNSVTVAASTVTAGTLTYALVNVRDASSSACLQAQTGSAVVTVNPLPTATITGTTVACRNGASPDISFTGASGTAPYTFTYMINGGTNQTVTTLLGNSVPVPVSTGTAGIFTYVLVSVRDGSATSCSQTQGGSATVTVNPLPTATISGTTAVCKDAASPGITFTGASGTAPYTFTYTINGGADQTVTTISGNSIIISASTVTAGTFTYALVSVVDVSSTACSQTQTGSAIITVNPLPTATISGTTSVCRNAISPNITFTGASGTAPYTFTYTINGGTSQTVTTITGNSITVAAPAVTAGTFTYALVSVRDASPTTCSQVQTGSAVVTVNALPATSVITGNQTPACSATGVIYSVTLTPGSVYTWTVPTGSTITSGSAGPNNNSITVSFGTTNGNVSVIETNSTGCAGTQQNLPISLLGCSINANFVASSTTVCNGSAITFTDLSTGVSGSSAYSWNFGTGASPLTATGSGPHSVTYTGTGAKTVSLLITEGASDTETKINYITVNPLPTATISGTLAVCRNGASPVITFTGASGTAPYTFTYTINGGVNQTVTTISGNSVTVPVPTGTAGAFTYTLVSVRDASTPACSQTQTGSAVVTVNPLPTATISGSTAVCKDATSPDITFTGVSGTSPYTFTYTINSGGNQTVTTTSGNSITVPVPTGTTGIFTYTLVSVHDASSTTCTQAQTGSAVIIVNPLPTATISGTTAVCRNAASPNITFTGASGTAPYTFTYTINGGISQTVTTISGNSVTVPVPTETAGAFTYALVSVRDASSTTCSQAQTGSALVTVNPLPTATISGATAVCKDATSPNITFTGATGTAPYTFTYTINGGGSQTVTTISGNSVTVPVPTGTAGTYTYTLVSVRDASSTACSQVQTGSAMVTVNPLPTSTISGTTVVCRSGASPNITFTGASGTAPYTFTYTVNSGTNQTVTTISGNSVIVPVPTGATGTFTYALVSVRDASSTTCSQTQGGSATVTINHLPTATISGTTAVCKDATFPNITFTGASGIAPYTFTYSINGGSNQTLTTISGNSITEPVPTGTAGTFTYALVSVHDASTTACSQAQTGSAVVTINPLPTATISGTTVVCRNGASPDITFTGASGTAPYIFTYRINSGINQTVTTTSGNSVAVSIPTGATGIFIYTLLSVRDGSTTACSQTQTGNATVTVNPLPTATIGGTTAVCEDGLSPNITFTGALGVAPYTFTYTINGGSNQTVTTTVGNSITVPVPTGTAGIFTYALVSVRDASSTACFQTLTGSAVVTVNQLPTATISGTTVVCRNETSPDITFTGASGTAPYIFTYTLNGGGNQTVTTTAGNSVTVAASTVTAGNLTYALVSVRDASSTACSRTQTGSAVVTVNPLPTATISGTTVVCRNGATPNITFTGASGTAPYTFTYTINGGDNQVVTTTTGNNVTITVPTGTAGLFTIALVSVRDGSATSCSQTQGGSATVTVNPLPTATISGTTVVCKDAASPGITFTGASGTAPYTFTYTINGGGNQTVTTISGNSIIVPVPTVTAGTFTYALVNVVDASSTACSQTQTGSAIITVNPLPTAIISGATSVCRNAASPNITFTGASGTAPYTFTYTINGGTSQTVTTITGNSITVAAPAVTAGTFTYALVSVRDASPTTCSQVQTGSAVVTVNPLPATSVITGNQTPACSATGVIYSVTLTPGSVYTWTVPTGSTITSGSAGPNNNTITVSFGITNGNVSVIETNSTGCAGTQQNLLINLLGCSINANFVASSTSLCDGSAITFTNLSTGVSGSTLYSWNFGTGASPSTATGSGPHSVTYTGTGARTVSLVITEGASDTETKINYITVNPLPTATITGTTIVCRTALSPDITFTGASGTAPYTFTYTSNGGVNQTVTTISGNSVTIPVPMGTAGIFTYALVSIRDASSTACLQLQTGNAVVTVNPLPTAAISGTATICRNAASPNITFTGASGTAPYTFTYTINGGGNQTVSTITGNSITVAAPSAVAGIFTYALVSIRDASPTTCSQAQTGSAVVTVNPLPATSGITGNQTPNCSATGVIYTVTLTPGSAYSWTVPAGSTITSGSTGPNNNSITVSFGTNNGNVSVIETNSSGCVGTQQNIPVSLQGCGLNSDFVASSTSVCNGSGITFTNLSTGATVSTAYSWNFGTGASPLTATGSGPHSVIYTGTGARTVTLTITEGASDIETKTNYITVNPLPTATINGTTVVCRNATSPVITFTGALGTSPYTFTYTINGGINQTVTTIVGNSVIVPVSTVTAGTFTYTLVSVRDASITTCSQAQTGNAVVTVNLLPTATIAGTTAVCKDATSPDITFTGASGTAPYTFSYTINSGSIQTVTTIAGNNVTVSVPTGTAGTFTYALVSVRDASSTACSQLQTGNAVVTINPLPTATISGTTVVCRNGASPNITFTGASGTAPYTFTYTINSGINQTVTTTSGNSVTVPVLTGSTGTFTYALVSIRDASSTTCSQIQGGSATVTVNQLPTATISGTTVICKDAASPGVTFTGASGTAPYTFTYNINGGGNQTVTTTSGNSIIVLVPTGTLGTFTYALVSVRDASSTACSQLQTGSAVVTVNPLPTATISGTTAVCRNAASPNITFTGASGTAPYTFTYTINGGTSQTVTTISGNSITVAAPSAAAGTFTYALISVRDASPTTCSQLQTGSAVVTVNALPATSVISGNQTPACTATGVIYSVTLTPGSNYLWTVPTGSTITSGSTGPNNNSITISFGTNNGNVSVIETNSAGCAGTQQNLLISLLGCSINANFSASSTSICNGSVVTFTNLSTGVSGSTAYSWNFGTGVSPLTATGSGPHSVTYTGTGARTVSLVITEGASDTETKINYITVNPLPTAIIGGTTIVCRNGASPGITFTGASGTAPYTFIYTVNGGTNQTVTTLSGNSIIVPVSTATAGTFTYALVSVRDASSAVCLQAQTGSAVVTVDPLPTATIGGTTSVCKDAASPVITFTGASGTAPYTFTYTINGGGNQTVTTIAGNSVTVAVPTGTAGNFTYALVSVLDAGSIACSQAQTGNAVVTVNPLPTATISGTTVVCRSGASPNITFTGASGTAPYTFTYSINSAANLTVTTTSGNSVTVPVSTLVTGTFTYAMVSVRDASSTTCSQIQGGSATVTVNPLPTATINGTTSVCKNGVSPNITFTGASGIAPYTFTYTINGGSNQTITTITGNSVTQSVSTGAAGIFTYALVSVRDASPTTCSQTQTGSVVVTVNALPTATINGTTAVCEDAASPLITFTGASGTAPYTFTYTVNGGFSQTVTTTSGNSVTVAVPTGTTGIFIFAMVSVRDGSTTSCSQAQGGSATVTVNPLPIATISGTTTVCRNAASPGITFTGASGTAPYTFTYTINGGPSQTVTTTVGNSIIVLVPTGTANTFTYTLVSVRDAGSSTCLQAQTGGAIVTVNPLPTAVISGTTAVCRNGASPNITFTGASGTAPYTFTYTINGGTSQTITTITGNSITVAVPTVTTGTSTYALVNVRDANPTACLQAQTGSAVVTVNTLPVTSVITGNQTPACSSTGVTYTVTLTPGSSYLWTVPSGSTITSGSTGPNNNSITVSFGTTNGNVSVTETNSTGCAGTQQNLPISLQGCGLNANFTASSTTVCNGSGVTFTDLSTGVSGSSSYIWNFGTGASPLTATGSGPHSVTYTGTGARTVSLVITEGASDTESKINYITVNPLPTATISGTTVVCRNGVSPVITFTGASGAAPYTFTYTINGGINQTVTTIAGNSVTVPVPIVTAGIFTYALVSVRDASPSTCSQLQSGSAAVTVNPLPTATISGTTAVCKDGTSPDITFTGASGTAPYTFTYKINVGGNQTVTTTSGNSVTVPVPTGTAGTFIYALVSVRDASSTACSQTQTGSAVVTVNTLPTAMISGTTVVCRNAPSPNITFTGASGTAPYTFTYTVNSGINQTVTTIIGNSVTVPVPLGTAGTFTYALVSVRDASSTTCSQSQPGSATVTVNPLPTATISGTTSVCKDAPFPNITFTGAAGIAPYTFTFTFNGNNQVLTTITGNSITVPVPSGTAGTFTYILLSVRDASSTTCSQLQSGSAVVTVNALPTATITGTTTVCRNGVSPDIIFTGASGTAPYTFTYRINSGLNQTVTTISGNSVNVPVPTGIANSFTYALVSVRDASSTTCSQSQPGSATVTVNPSPTGTISGTTAVCEDGPFPNITFTGASGTAPYTFTYSINGAGNQTVTTTAGNSVTIPVPTGISGIFTYTLVSVRDAGSTACLLALTGSAVVTVNPLPTAIIGGTTVVCRNGASPDITFAGASGTTPYTFTYRINSGINQTVTTTSGNTVTVAVPTSTATTLTYTLISVRDGSSTTCSQIQTGTAVVKINPLPTATITGTTVVCEDTASPFITFTGAAGTAPYTFTYTLNGLNQVVTTTTGNSVTVAAPTSTSGIYTYVLVSVSDASSTTCLQTQTGSAVITVNAFPVSNAGSGGNECDLNFIFNAVPSVGIGTWTKSSGPGTTIFTPNANAPNATGTVSAYGTYTLTWTENNGTCSNSSVITVNFYRQPVANPGTGGNECDLNFLFNATPSFGVGTWTSTAGPGTASFSNQNSATATVTVSIYGTYTFRWTEVNGTCSNSATVTVNFYQQPVAKPGTGGNNCGTEFFLSAVPGVGTGTWTRTAGPGTAVFSPNPNTPNASVTVSVFGTYTFRWTEVNGTCSNFASVNVNFITNPSANAGADGEECDLNFGLNAIPGVGTGTWTRINGPGNAVFSPNPNQPNAKVTVDLFGTYDFAWTEVNSTCQSTDLVKVTFHPLPSVSAGRDTTICVGESVQLKAQGTGSFHWLPVSTVSDPDIANPFATPLSPTNYVVTLTDQFGCANTDAVLVNTLVIPVANAGTGGSECDLNFIFNAVPSVGVGTWSITTGPGTASFAPDPNSPSAVVTVSVSGTYTFTWTELNGTCSNSSAITVNFYKKPVANPGIGGSSCSFEFLLKAIPSVGAGTWTKTTGPATASATFTPNANAPSPMVTVSAYGNYSFTWTEVNGTCADSAAVNVNFIQVSAANAGKDSSVCDLDIILNAIPAAGAGTGTWTKLSGPGNAIFSPDLNQPGAKVKVDQFGTYDFAWTEEYIVCQSTDVVRVVFRNLPSISAGQDTIICIGETIQLQGQGVGTFLWEPAMLLNNPNIINPIASPVTSTLFNVTLTDQAGCRNIDTIMVEVWNKPLAFAGPDMVLDYKFGTVINASVPGINESGIWSLVSGAGELSDPTEAENYISALSAGENILVWSVTNGVCPVTHDSLTILVHDLVIPTLITPNMDGKNDYFVLKGIETLGKTELIIFDRRGAQVYKNGNYDNLWNGIDYNGNQLPDDTYFYVLKTENGKSVSGYIVVRR